MPTRFVIFASPRCGSNWLCSLLDSHPDIMCHHELFNPDGIHLSRTLRLKGDVLGGLAARQKAPLELLARAWSTTKCYRAVGFKLNLGQSETVFNHVISDPGIRKIILSRNNRIRSYVSEIIAEKTNVWESFPDSETVVDPGPQHIDVADLFQRVQRNREYYRDVRRRIDAAGQSALSVSYEDLGDRETGRKLLRFLDVDPEAELVAETSRMNRGSLRSLIGNFTELEKELADTELLPDLANGGNT